MKKLTPKQRHHVGVTLVVAVATAAHFITEALAPSLTAVSPLAGLAANLFWIWSE